MKIGLVHMATPFPTEDKSAYQDYLPLVVHLRPVLELTDDEFFAFCQINRDLRIERNAQGELIIMPPTGGLTGLRNAQITVQLGLWAKHDGTGFIFDSSTGFRLPNGAVRSPDAAWIRQTRLSALTEEQMQKFIPLCPDFVIELRSDTDSLPLLREKMQEYLDNGAQLGWLLDPEQKRVYIYRPRQTTQELDNPETLSGQPVLGFILNLGEVW
jgi:Uma2 family endonuclease